jgi:hypothetical protein
MTSKGYTVNGWRAMVEIGTAALDGLRDLLLKFGEDGDVAEIRIYENMPIEAVVYHPDYEFATYVWDGEKWVTT